MIIAGIAIPAIRVIPTGAPTKVPNCQRIFFFLLHGFLPQNVQPDGLKNKIHNIVETTLQVTKISFQWLYSCYLNLLF